MSQPGKKRRWLFLLAAALPPCLAGLLILKCGVDFPFSDEWEIVPLLVKKAHGTLALSDLFAQVNEYRQFFPNLVFVYLAQLTRWDLRYEMLVSFLLACAVSCNVFLLGGKTVRAGGAARAAAFLLSNAFVFSPAQYENWLMGQQLIFFIPAACVTACLLVSYSGLRVWAKLLVCAALSSVSSFSSANGLLCWVVAFPALAGPEFPSKPKKFRWLTPLWVAGFAACLALYFYGFRRPAYLPPTSEPFVRPLQAVAYFLALLGAPLTGDNRYLAPLAAAAGLTLLALFASAWLVYLRPSTGGDLRRRMTCWLMLGAYSVLTAVLVTFGRAGYGVEQALSSRYTTFSLYLAVALIHLTAILRDARGERALPARLLDRRALAAAVAGLSIFYALASAVSVRAALQQRTRLRQAKACLLFVNLVPDECLPPDLMAFPDKLPERLNALDRMGFLRPGLMKSRRAADFAVEPASGFGSFDQLSRDGQVFAAAGRARLPYRGEPADAVLLTYRTKDDNAVLFSVAEMDYKGDVLKLIPGKNPDYTYFWKKTFPQNSLPADAVEVSAWALDADTGKAYKLEGERSIK
jgi:hypothetical protein